LLIETAVTGGKAVLLMTVVMFAEILVLMMSAEVTGGNDEEESDNAVSESNQPILKTMWSFTLIESYPRDSAFLAIESNCPLE
jgi:hypothetical protein